MGEDAFCQDLAQLDAFLVEAVQVPDEALEHHLVLKVGQQGAEGFRSQLIADHDAGGTSAVEVLVAVLVALAAGESHDLGGHIGAELLLAGAALDLYVHTGLVLFEADELQRDDIGSLALEVRLKKLEAEEKKGDVVTFEQLGVDRLYVYAENPEINK